MILAQIDEVNSEARQRLRAELVVSLIVLLALIVGLAVIYAYLESQCWFHWFGYGSIEIRDRYYQIEGGLLNHVTPGQVWQVPDKRVLFGVDLTLQRQCFGPDIYAEVHNYYYSQGQFLETVQGQVATLHPTAYDVTKLSGFWIRPGSGLYLVKIWVRPSMRPEDPYFIYDFSTFRLQ